MPKPQTIELAGKTFTLRCMLKEKADATQCARDRTIALDKWQCFLSCGGTEIEFDFNQGMAYRNYKIGKQADHNPPKTIYDFECLAMATPQPPDIDNVVISLGTDYQAALDMPRKFQKAGQYLIDEYGYENDFTEICRLVTALQDMGDKLDKLTFAAGIPTERFIECCVELDQ